MIAALSAMARQESSSSEWSTPVGGSMEMPARRLVGILGHECPEWVAQEGIASLVSHARDVHHPETIAKGLRFLNIVLGISSRERSPKSLRRGLWSTAMIRSLQPSTKWRALSSASATVSASPSTGA